VLHLRRKIYTGLRVAYGPNQITCFFREGLAYFSNTMHGFSEFSLIENTKYSKEDPGLLSSWNPTSDKNGTRFLSQRSSYWYLQFPDVNRLLLKEEGMEHSVPTFQTCCCHI